MTHHATALAISSYLDDELDAVASREFETHLDECDACRERLRSMRRVTTDLRALTPHVPPPTLAGSVGDRVRSLEHSLPWLERFEKSLKGWSLQSEVVPLFATLVAIGMMIVLLAYAASNSASRGEDRGDEAILETTIRQVVGDRIFEQEDGVWFEAGATGVPDRVIDLRGREIPPDVRGLERVGPEVQIELGGERVRILFDEPDAR